MSNDHRRETALTYVQSANDKRKIYKMRRPTRDALGGVGTDFLFMSSGGG